VLGWDSIKGLVVVASELDMLTHAYLIDKQISDRETLRRERLAGMDRSRAWAFSFDFLVVVLSSLKSKTGRMLRQSRLSSVCIDRGAIHVCILGILLDQCSSNAFSILKTNATSISLS
jgi:hypothetical protein